MDINDYQKRFVLIEENLRLIGQELQLFREETTEYKGSQYYFHTIPDADRRSLLHLCEALKEVVERELRWNLQDFVDAARNSLKIPVPPMLKTDADKKKDFDASKFVESLSPEVKAMLALKIKQGL